MDEAERERQLLESYRAEALALFQVNQAGRVAADRGLTLILTASAIAIGAGINAKTDLVAAALAPVVLVLLSYTFQQYADVTVNGAARAILERKIAHDSFTGTYPLIYEHAVAGVRQRKPLVRSVRLLQVTSGIAVAGVVAVGFAVTFHGHHSSLIQVGYCLGIALGLATAGSSAKAMLDSGQVAKKQIEQTLDIGKPSAS